MTPIQFFAGLALSALIGLAAYWRGSLTRSGVAGAILTGTAIFGSGGLLWGILLVAFFASSSLLSGHNFRAKESLEKEFQKGSRRDLGQALANGAWAALIAIVNSIHPTPVVFAAFVGALSAVTADTWATEIGVLSPHPPRLLTTGKTIDAGTSGAVSTWGLVASALGGLFIGTTALVAVIALAFWDSYSSFGIVDLPAVITRLGGALLLLPVLGMMSGLAGSLFDSYLGATVQATYFCDYHNKQTERRLHSCGRQTRLVRGVPWLDNDVVNFLASIVGSIVAALFWVAFT